MTVDPDDEFFGDQSSESDSSRCADQVSGNEGIRGKTPSNPFGNVATHEYRSREESVRNLSYLDGYDETKEEKLQDGFSEGYRQSFNDALRIGRRLGYLGAKAALGESLTLVLQPGISNDKSHATDRNFTKNVMENPANLVRQFLTDEILVASKESAENSYDEALLKLEDQLERMLKI
mmetsp:Transcript_50629/g.107879  ORF Transcript_50629/g.107879 Transcript_50629/m.107879 type:complete len:178 (+) Transcript_50629:94-627(+)|eukprot:CAMPEP_0172529164 /NCGR_PEP_ID=MMETSP1067-20121228/3316_1 /TAXON_ID=265564 ORGANISM="Thalassiosira punctigera, Strain Tpunct2005C2" /NCGR_SAMPLE_ID=MMETSP1067 /ASSEMBLY_ACC=CAM_ASM_000444 /LENGTH=177 /DNA_ID=CAMNT_0013313167 /DNA_START=94 /DNA_END=627 /DNA_ORIENTATION=+